MEDRNVLKNSRVYLSGPMDFVASRQNEKDFGWRSRIKNYLESKGVVVFDPWEKPEVVGIHEYGKEDDATLKIRKEWSYGKGEQGSEARANCAEQFSTTVHIDLRMVDISDFIIAYCPTNIYSVGTVHEIVVARQQHKPVLLVSPPVTFPVYNSLREQTDNDEGMKENIAELAHEIPIKQNEKGIPSLWYMSVVGSENFFDGFGFSFPAFAEHMADGPSTRLDQMELEHPPERPLIEFLEALSNGIMPQKWNSNTKSYEIDDDWLIMEKF